MTVKSTMTDEEIHQIALRTDLPCALSRALVDAAATKERERIIHFLLQLKGSELFRGYDLAAVLRISEELK